MLSLHVITIMMVIMGCRGYPGQCSSIRGGDGIPLHVMGMHMDHRGCRASEGGPEGLQMGPFGLSYGPEGSVVACRALGA